MSASEAKDGITLVHERGLTARSQEESDNIRRVHGLHPVLYVQHRETYEVEMTLSHEGNALEFQLTDLYSAGTSDVSLIFKTFALAYDAGAMLYHCRKLARAYASTVEKPLLPWLTASDGVGQRQARDSRSTEIALSTTCLPTLEWRQ